MTVNEVVALAVAIFCASGTVTVSILSRKTCKKLREIIEIKDQHIEALKTQLGTGKKAKRSEKPDVGELLQNLIGGIKVPKPKRDDDWPELFTDKGKENIH